MKNPQKTQVNIFTNLEFPELDDAFMEKTALEFGARADFALHFFRAGGLLALNKEPVVADEITAISRFQWVNSILWRVIHNVPGDSIFLSAYRATLITGLGVLKALEVTLLEARSICVASSIMPSSPLEPNVLMASAAACARVLSVSSFSVPEVCTFSLAFKPISMVFSAILVHHRFRASALASAISRASRSALATRR